MKCRECPDYRECNKTRDLRRYRHHCGKAKEQKVFTNGDRYRAMSDREMAALIYNGISSDPCDYCANNNDNCCGALCKGKASEEIIENWLKQPAEEET